MGIPATDVAELVLGVARRLRRATGEQFEGLPVKPHQARALRTIARIEPVRMADLAERLHVAARSATEVVDVLVEGGWVERSPDPDDRRARLLRLTASGRALAADAQAARARAAEAVLGGMPPADRDAVVAALLGVAGPAP